MFGWLKRLFGIAEAETNALLDKMEDPVKMAEQGLRNLKTDLTKGLQGLAEVKALAIRNNRELEANQLAAADYESKAIALLQKAQRGELDAQEADRLASQALAKKDQLVQRVAAGEKNRQQYEVMVSKMEENVDKIKTQINDWENELKTLKARHTVSQATAKLNKQLTQIDSSDTVALLERMKQKVEQQEALAESYADMADSRTSVDDEINRALGGGTGPGATAIESESLKQLKAKMASGNAESYAASSSQQAGGSGSAEAPAGEAVRSELDKLKEQLRNGQA